MLLAADEHDSPADMAELSRVLEASGELRSAVLLSALERCRQLLVSTPSDAPVDTPVQLLLVDVAAMARALMARLR